MYEKFYNLEADPFEPGPDDRFRYEHGHFAKAQTYMSYAFMFSEGFAMVTGRPGAGKTTLIGKLLEGFSEQGVKTVNLASALPRDKQLLRAVADGFGIERSVRGKEALLEQLHDQLQRWQDDDIRGLLIVDEAQDLSKSDFEDLLHLANMGETGKPLLQIFLVGQPELRGLLATSSMEPVRRRIIAETHLEGLEEEEVESYVRHRLEAVGWQSDPSFSQEVFPLIHQFSEGVPGRINLLCSRLLSHSSKEGKHEIGVDDTLAIIEKLKLEAPFPETDVDDSERAVSVGFDPKEDVFNAYGTSEDESVADDATLEFAALEVEPDETISEPEETTEEPDESSQQNWIAVGSDTARISGSGSRRHAPARKTTRRRRGGGSWYIGLFAIFALILWGWLVYGSGFESLSAWREKADDWWQPVVADLRSGNDKSLTENPELEVMEVKEPDSAPEPATVSLSRPETPAPISAQAQTQIQTSDSTSSTPTAAATPTATGGETETTGQGESENPDGLSPAAEPLLVAGEPGETAASLDCTRSLRINFGNDSSRLSEDAQILLDDVMQNCMRSGLSKVRVTGYTDSWGDWDYNLRLSRRRAEAVVQYLVAQGVDPESVFAEGLGEYGFDQPASASDSTDDEGRRIVLVEILAPAAVP